MTMPRKIKSAEERFWSKVDKNGPTPLNSEILGRCWEYRQVANRNEYGSFYFNGTSETPHRVSLLLNNTQIPNKMQVVHLCKRRSCVNPNHLTILPIVKNAINRTVRPRKTILERFFDKINKNGPLPTDIHHLGRCWTWTASLRGDGYGQFSFEGRMIGSHRVSVMLFGRSIDRKMEIDHLCNNIICVNPDHLDIVTSQENSKRKWLRLRKNQKLNLRDNQNHTQQEPRA